MPLYITIAAAVSVAVTAKLMYTLFLSGGNLSKTSLFGCLLDRVEPARRAFAAGWRRRDWRYLLVAWPCMLASMGLASLFLRWMMPALDAPQTFGDKIRFGLLVFGIGVAASILLALLLILSVYYLRSLIDGWLHPETESACETALDQASE